MILYSVRYAKAEIKKDLKFIKKLLRFCESWFKIVGGD
jgi:hypothetical protein